MTKGFIKHSSYLGAYVQNEASIFGALMEKFARAGVESASVALRDIINEALRLQVRAP
jgi:hypothetical protein